VFVAKLATVTVPPPATKPVEIVCKGAEMKSPNSLYVGVPIAELVFTL
jgi:hypothetical protein